MISCCSFDIVINMGEDGGGPALLAWACGLNTWEAEAGGP